MSHTNQKSFKSDLTDGKLDDKYESADSGFLSGGNLTVSGEILSEEIVREVEVVPEQQQQSSFMRLDSGVDLGLSESFSGLNLKSPGLNDLSKKSTTEFTSTGPLIQEHPQQQQDKHPDDYYQQDENGDTLLHIAIDQGFIEVALTLIRIAPHPLLLDTPNDDAQTPIHLAVSTGQSKLVRWLIVAGAKPAPRNKNGDSPLHIAARMGDLDCCKAITDPVQEQERELLALRYPQQSPYHQFNLDQWNYEGQTCVHVAAINGHINVLRHLVWYGADINAREGRTGYTTLHFAIEKGNERLIQFLLTECKQLNVGAVTYGGCSALQLGCQVPEKFFETLRSRGAASPYITDDEDYSDSESEPEINYDNAMYIPNLVNASA